MTAEQVKVALAAIAAAIAEREQEINELDAVIGDGDHGISMNRGFTAVVAAMAKLPAEADVATVLRQTGMTLLSAMGGSSGPLYASVFLELSKAVAGKDAPALADWARGARSGVEAICRRGNSTRGQKTLLDAMFPAVEALEAGAEQGLPATVALANAVAAARAGRDATAGMVAARGRASYLGERSLGHVDAGAAMFCVVLEAVVRIRRDIDA